MIPATIPRRWWQVFKRDSPPHHREYLTWHDLPWTSDPARSVRESWYLRRESWFLDGSQSRLARLAVPSLRFGIALTGQTRVRYHAPLKEWGPPRRYTSTSCSGDDVASSRSWTRVRPYVSSCYILKVVRGVNPVYLVFMISALCSLENNGWRKCFVLDLSVNVLHSCMFLDFPLIYWLLLCVK